MLRPGKEFRLKCCLRKFGAVPRGDVAMVGDVTSVNYSLKDSQGNEVLKGDARVNAAGGFDMTLKLPPTMNLGYSPLTLTAVGAGALGGNSKFYNHNIRVQEFRRPEYEVKPTASESPYFVRDHATLTVAPTYYAAARLAA